MACDITQDDLGPAFADVDPDLAALFIETATSIVLGPTDCQAEDQLKWLNCCVDPCTAIKLLAQHLISTTPGSGGGAGATPEITSKRVGEISVSYASAGSSSGLFAGSKYGAMFSLLLGKYERCRASRRSLPFAVPPARGCSC